MDELVEVKIRLIEMIKSGSYHNKILREIHEEKRKILGPEYRYALEIIADKMYKEKHFIRELIQNADDAGSKKILFEIDMKNRIIKVTNWGKPFDEKDVRQICTMLPSEKKATQIGALGVGFKSIFGISDNPKIFSSGFNFELTDYILPTEINTINLEKNQEDTTIFVIPLQTQISVESIIERFHSLNSEMILFLNNIKEIDVRYVDNEKDNFTIRKDIVTTRKFRQLKNEYTAITYTKGTGDTNESRWIVIKRKYKIPENIKSEIRKALKEEMKRIYKHPQKFFRPAEINRKIERKVLRFINPSIAILSTKDWNLNKMAESKLFISLPTEIMTGLKFHINAEFKPSADRSGIDKTPINDWMISKTADVVCEMTEFMKNTKKYQCQFYTILPDLKDIARIDDKEIIFDTIHSDIRDYSTMHNIILTSNNKWAKKDEVCFTEHEEIRNLLSRKDLLKNFGKKYFVSDNLARGSKAFLDSIEIPMITLKDFIDFLSDKSNLKDKSPSWFFDVYAYLGKHLEEYDEDKESIEKLKKAYIVFTENKTLESTFESDRTIYFPPEANLDTAFNLFKEDIFFIHRKVFLPPKKQYKNFKNRLSYAKQMLSKLGVTGYNPVNLIDDTILKKFKLEDDEFDLLDEKGNLYQYLAYIKNHFKEYKKKHDNNWKDIRDKIWIKAKNGTYYLPGDLYLPIEYTGNKDLEELFEGMEEIFFVDEKYLTYDGEKKKKDEKLAWFNFLKELGVENKPRIITSLTEEEFNYNDHSEQIKELGRYGRSASGWGEYLQYDKKSIDIKKIIDYAKNCPFDEGKQKIEKLIEIISRNWDQYNNEIKKEIEDNWQIKQYGTIDSAKWKYHHYDWYNKKVYSNLKCFLTSTSWIPTTLKRFRKPSEVYINDAEITKLVGEKRDFITLNIDNRDLIKFLELNDKAKTKDMIENLLNLTKEDYREEKAKFILRCINNPKSIANLIEKIGERNEIGGGFIQLTNMIYEKFNIKIIEAERNDESFYGEYWWIFFKNNARILTKNNGFLPPSTVFFPPPPHLNTMLKRSKIENIPFLHDDWRRYETFAKTIGVNELEYGSNVKCELVEPNETEIVDDRTEYVEFERKIEEIIPFVNGVEIKKVTNESDRIRYGDIFGDIRVYCIPKLKLQYSVIHNGQRYKGNPIPSPVYLRKSSTQTELYIRTNVKNDKRNFELIANELSMLTNPKGDRDYMAKTIKECLLGYPPLDIEKIKEISSEISPLEEPSPEEPPTIEPSPEEPPTIEPPLEEPPTIEPSPEEPPTIEPSPEEPPQEPKIVLIERQIRDSRSTNWVKKSYDYHCQICLSREKPEILTYNESYAGRKANRKSIMEAHHIKEVAKDRGHDHTGNYLSLCHDHHVLLHRLNLSLDNLKDSLNNIYEKEIVWPNGESVKWNIIPLSDEFIEGNQAIKIVINQRHLEKLKEYINIIYSDDSKQ